MRERFPDIKAFIMLPSEDYKELCINVMEYSERYASERMKKIFEDKAGPKNNGNATRMVSLEEAFEYQKEHDVPINTIGLVLPELKSYIKEHSVNILEDIPQSESRYPEYFIETSCPRSFNKSFLIKGDIREKHYIDIDTRLCTVEGYIRLREYIFSLPPCYCLTGKKVPETEKIIINRIEDVFREKGYELEYSYMSPEEIKEVIDNAKANAKDIEKISVKQEELDLLGIKDDVKHPAWKLREKLRIEDENSQEPRERFPYIKAYVLQPVKENKNLCIHIGKYIPERNKEEVESFWGNAFEVKGSSVMMGLEEAADYQKEHKDIPLVIIGIRRREVTDYLKEIFTNIIEDAVPQEKSKFPDYFFNGPVGYTGKFTDIYHGKIEEEDDVDIRNMSIEDTVSLARYACIIPPHPDFFSDEEKEKKAAAEWLIEEFIKGDLYLCMFSDYKYPTKEEILKKEKSTAQN